MKMKVQIKRRWASRLPGQIASVSVERARILVDSGIAKAIDDFPPEKKVSNGKK